MELERRAAIRRAYVFEAAFFRLHVAPRGDRPPAGAERANAAALRLVFDDPANARERARLLAEETGPRSSRRPGELDAGERLRERDRFFAAVDGAYAIWRVPRRRIVMNVAAEETPVLGPEEEEPARVDFYFELADGAPVSGLDYVLVDDAGQKTKGTLGKDGAVGRANATGTYAVIVKEIDLLDWERSRVMAKMPARIAGKVSGIDDGTSGKIEVFRLYREGPKDALASVPVTVQDGRVDATWTYDPKASGGPPGADGCASFVAQLSFEGGKIWKKTPPLVVETPAILACTWSCPTASPGDSVDLVVQTAGFTDAAQVTIALFSHDVDGDDRALDGAPTAALSGGRASASLACGDGGALPAHPCDVYAKVKVKEGDAERTATAPLLWIGGRGRGAPDTIDAASAA